MCWYSYRREGHVQGEGYRYRRGTGGAGTIKAARDWYKIREQVHRRCSYDYRMRRDGTER